MIQKEWVKNKVQEKARLLDRVKTGHVCLHGGWDRAG